MTLRKILLAATVFSTAALTAHAHHDGETVKAGDIVVGHAWTLENAEMAHGMQVYLTINNTGSEPDQLVSAQVDEAGEVVFQAQAVDDQGVLSVRDLKSIQVQPGQTLTFQPGAIWLEVDGIQHTYEGGEHFEMTLEFARAGTVQLDVEVEHAEDEAHEDHEDEPSS